MIYQANIHEAKTHFSELLAHVMAGEEIIIAKAGSPVARLVPFQKKRRRRVFGSAKGKIWVSEDFDNPLPPDLLKKFYK